MRSLLTGIVVLLVVATGAERTSAQTYCAGLSQLSGTTNGTLQIEFHTAGAVADLCGTLQACPNAGTLCTTGPIAFGPAVSAAALRNAIVAAINAGCGAFSASVDPNGFLQISGPGGTSCSLVGGDIAAGQCLPLMGCTINNFGDGVVGNEGAAYVSGYRLRPQVCVTIVPATSTWGLVVLTALLMAAGAWIVRRRRAAA